MAFADGSGTRLAYIAEVTEGTTPATPAFQNLRFTGETLTGEKQTVISDEIRPDGNIPDIVKVGHQVSGGFGFEMSYSTFDDHLESLLCGTWAADVLTNARDRHAFTFEKTFETGATDVYRRYVGCLIGGMNLDITAKQIVTGNATVLGRTFASDTAIIAGATYTTAGTEAVMEAASGFAALDFGGVSPEMTIKGMTINITNNLRPQDQVGSDDLAGIGLGQVDVSGTMSAYLEDTQVLGLLDNHTASSLSFTIGTITNEKYTFRIPKLYFSSGDALTPGNNTDVMIDMNWQAVYSNLGSPADDFAIEITRAVA
ncbi:MAG: phage tail tube protein [Hyphomicrobiales bacterium]|nr:phage tail tube protein [Hyphomicrobiales bacterium]